MATKIFDNRVISCSKLATAIINVNPGFDEKLAIEFCEALLSVADKSVPINKNAACLIADFVEGNLQFEVNGKQHLFVVPAELAKLGELVF